MANKVTKVEEKKKRGRPGRPVLHVDSSGARQGGYRIHLDSKVVEFLDKEQAEYGRSWSATVNQVFFKLIAQREVLGGKSDIGGLATFINRYVESGKLDGESSVTWEELGLLIAKFDRITEKRTKEALNPTPN